MKAVVLFLWQKLKVEMLQQFDCQMDEFVDSVVEESSSLGGSSLNSHFSPLLSDKERAKLRYLHHSIRFCSNRPRPLLSDLFEVDHIRTIYHMFIALLILFILSTLVVDFIDEGRLVLDFDLLVYAFGQFPLVVVTWICMFMSALVVPYVLLHSWAGLGLGFLPTYIVLRNGLPPASRFILILEQVRLMMKVHSFIRENIQRVWSSGRDGSDSSAVPQVTPYLYFLFVLGCLFYAYYVFVRLCIPQFRSLQLFDLRAMVLCVFNSILPGVLVLFLGFFAFLHCWLNAFAEMLRFGDRMFYKDWWNSTSFANYYRTWNVVVHDWLYYYVYRDFLWMSQKRFRAAAMFIVFTVSAVVHEYVLAICFGFFYPVLFCLFMCFGMMFNFILHDRRKGPVWNVIMWTALFLGQGVLICLYSQEWYAQIYCPLQEPSLLDLLKPRSWTCYMQTNHEAAASS
uniref:Sterol O-acyltransferase 1 n=1 Tax=Astyanax mexicanus TaxID=7994 RepID=A0A3B1K817_ASTMX